MLNSNYIKMHLGIATGMPHQEHQLDFGIWGSLTPLIPECSLCLGKVLVIGFGKLVIARFSMQSQVQVSSAFMA